VYHHASPSSNEKCHCQESSAKLRSQGTRPEDKKNTTSEVAEKSEYNIKNLGKSRCYSHIWNFTATETCISLSLKGIDQEGSSSTRFFFQRITAGRGFPTAFYIT
jgi:hypothetical protein